MSHWLMHVFGLDNASGTAYLAWSGFGSDLSELLLLGGIATWARHKNCEVHRCWRLGRHATAAGHHVCRRHSPAGAPTHAQVIAAHEAAQQGESDAGI